MFKIHLFKLLTEVVLDSDIVFMKRIEAQLLQPGFALSTFKKLNPQDAQLPNMCPDGSEASEFRLKAETARVMQAEITLKKAQTSGW